MASAIPTDNYRQRRKCHHCLVETAPEGLDRKERERLSLNYLSRTRTDNVDRIGCYWLVSDNVCDIFALAQNGHKVTFFVSVFDVNGHIGYASGV